MLSSVACAFAPNVYFLALFRMVQGLGGAAGMGMSRSIARDLHSGLALVKFFSALTVVTGLGPLIAPQIGSAILTFTSWRGIFIALAILGAVLLWSAWLRVPETLPEQYRSRGSVWSTPGSFVRIGRDRVFLSLALTYGFGMGGVFVYAAGSSFVLQNVYGLSPRSTPPCSPPAGPAGSSAPRSTVAWSAASAAAALLTAGCVIMIGSAGALLAVVATGFGGLTGYIASMLCFLFGSGFLGPNAMALALQRYPDAAGTAAALIGAIQFGLGGLAAPLAGVGGEADAYPMIFLMIAMPSVALLMRLVATRGPAAPTAAASPRDAAV